MSPKIPRKPPLSAVQSSDPANPATSRPDTPLTTGTPPGYRLPGFPDYANPMPDTGARPVTDLPRTPAVVIHEMPTTSQTLPVHDGSAAKYWLNDDFLRGMKPADSDGFRWIVGRRFVDVEYQGNLYTTHVGLDESGLFRSKLLTERQPSGPRLYKNDGRPTWRLSEQASETQAMGNELPTPGASQKRPAAVTSEPDAKRPRAASTPTFIDLRLYAHSSRSPDAQGYYAFTPIRKTDAADTRFAFKDRFGNWIEVDPPVAGFGAQPTHLKHWTDHEIWALYGIQGEDIRRFRAEAQTHGRAPQWAESATTNNPANDLARDALRWLHPGMTLKQREALLQSYNLLPSQLTRLRQDLKGGHTIPQWAQVHKRLTEEVSNPRRLDKWSQQAVNELNLKRDARHDWYSPETSLTLEVREALLKKLGYLRNKNNCLYRTDVPALFRGDERTPFELANDGFMLPRYHHEPGATTHKPMSATFSLNEGQMYARTPSAEYLLYNSQTHKYPGRSADDSGSESDNSDSHSSTSSDWSEPASPIYWDHDRHYEPTRTRQAEMFLYALDTRHLEVVPHEENMSFNSAARDTPPTWFPSDDFEGLISVTRSGLDSDRIWLINSALTKAVQIDHIKEQAGASAERIEAATHAGHHNKFEYDQLIDKAETAGKPVLRLSGNGDEFAYDIRWPEPEKTLTQDA
jgi:hypothetical protein